MGIAFLVKDFINNDLVVQWTIYFLGFHFIGFFYFWKVHPKLFKPNASIFFAVVFSSIGIGFGEAYSRRFLRGFFFLGAVTAFTIANKVEWIHLSESTFELNLLGLLFLSLLDAGICAGGRQKKLIEKRMEQFYQERKAQIVNLHSKGYAIAADASMLVHDYEILAELAEEPIQLTISNSTYEVLDELGEYEFDLWENVIPIVKDTLKTYENKGNLKVLDDPSPSFLERYDLADEPEDKEIGAFMHESLHGSQKIILFTYDEAVKLIAQEVDLPIGET